MVMQHSRDARMSSVLAVMCLGLALGCPPIAPDGTIPGTCNPGSPGCAQAPQCQSRAANPYMPIYHIIGNFTRGTGTQPAPINDVSAVLKYRGVYHVFHQFGQCGWAHAISYDLAHWRNLRYPVTPGVNGSYDAKGCFDGSLTMAQDINQGNPVLLYQPIRDDPHVAGLAVARPADLTDPELTYWVKDSANPALFEGPPAQFPSQIWKNGENFNFLYKGRRYTTTDPSFHRWSAVNQDDGYPLGQGDGGQWFEPLPSIVRGARSDATPTHLVANGRPAGKSFLLGRYNPVNESFTSHGVTSLTDSGHQFNWAALQYVANDTEECSAVNGCESRLMNIGWVTGIGLQWEGQAPTPHQAPNSLLSLMREVRYDAAIGLLVANPVRICVCPGCVSVSIPCP